MLNWTATIWPIAVSLAIKSTLLLAAAWLAAALLRTRSAAARHVVWTACAAALLALPLLSISLPALRLRAAGMILPADPGLVFRTSAIAAAGPSSTRATIPAGHSAPPAAPARPAPRDWRTIVLLTWTAGAALVLAQMVFACLGLRRLSRSARPHAESTDAASIARSLGIRTRVRLLETPNGMPMTFGFFRPAISLPAAAANWTAERRRIVLLHEFAHVLRGDVATHFLARTALALYWWNPLAWTAWREFLKERERAADDLVLSAGARQSEYASHLLEVARTMQSAPSTAAAIAMARPSQLEGRLLAILADNVNRRQPGRAAALIASTLAIAAVLPIAAIRAQSTPQPTVPPDVDAAIRTANAQKNHDLLEQAAGLYEDLRKFNEAQTLREASLALREQQSGKQSPEYIEGLVNLGNLARKRGNVVGSHNYYSQALAQGDRPEAITALINLGLDAYSKDQNAAAAFDYLQRARNVAKNGNDMGRAMTWMAFLKSKQPATAADADPLFRGAMAAEDLNSAEQALTLEFYANFLKSQDRSAEATPIAARASEIRKARAATLGPRSVTSDTALKVGNGVTAPALLTKMEPSYSEDARAAKMQGTVVLKIVVDVDGLAKDIQIANSLGYGLDEKAVEAVTHWTFRPATRGGVPVPAQALIEVNFRLL